jgi:hypothetical protein
MTEHEGTDSPALEGVGGRRIHGNRSGFVSPTIRVCTPVYTHAPIRCPNPPRTFRPSSRPLK